MHAMFSGVTLSPSNYDNLLLGWSQLSLQPDVFFNAGDSQYTEAAASARQSLIDDFSWTIWDGGLYIPKKTVPGYNLFILVGLIGLISVFIIKKHRSV